MKHANHPPEHLCVRCFRSARRLAWYHIDGERSCSQCLTEHEKREIDRHRLEAEAARLEAVDTASGL